MKRIVSVVGARPNFMKVAPIHRACAGRFEHVIVHTGQHYDARMSKSFFEELDLPEPEHYLNVGSASHAAMTAKIMIEFDRVLPDLRPDCLIVVGDVNSTMATTLVASKAGIPVAHVEAGLRSHDRTMPEELNRLVTDCLADYAFVTEPSAIENLAREGWTEGRIFFVGNTMIDTLCHLRSKAETMKTASSLGLSAGEFGLVTFHRPSNVDDPEQLRSVVDFIRWLGSELPTVFPLHPRTEARLASAGWLDELRASDGIILTPPQSYLHFLDLMSKARLVVTDSGGIQEETTYLQVPCITARTSTERPITCTVGTNRLCEPDPRELRIAVETAMNGEAIGEVPPLWDGRAAERIVRKLESLFS